MSEVVWACEEERPWSCGKIHPRDGSPGKERTTKTEMARLQRVKIDPLEKKGRPKLRWLNCVSSNLKDIGASEDDAKDKKRGKKVVSATATPGSS